MVGSEIHISYLLTTQPTVYCIDIRNAAPPSNSQSSPHNGSSYSIIAAIA